MKFGIRRNILVVALFLVLLFSVPAFIEDQYYLRLLILMALHVIVGVSIWIVMRVDRVSFGQAGFMAIGAYTSALMVTHSWGGSNASWLGHWYSHS